MVMNPRTHPRGAAPDFTLPRPNPNPGRMTDALWWLVCMRELLEPQLSDNGGTYTDKPGSHNAGENLPDYGPGDARTDHSIRHPWNRSGPWWRKFTAAHDWTFRDAQRGDYRTINTYTRRLINAMQDPDDLRPDLVVFYTLGNTDSDVQTEGYNEIRNGAESSGDTSHAWHRHDSFFRNVVGDFAAMWKVLTIDMGWSYQDWARSVKEDTVSQQDVIAALTSTQGRAALEVGAMLGVHDALVRGSTRADPTGRQISDAVQEIVAAGPLAAEVAAIREQLALLQRPTITLTAEQVETVGRVFAQASNDSLVDLNARLTAAGFALAGGAQDAASRA